jgi:high-affinity nickel-transport protein
MPPREASSTRRVPEGSAAEMTRLANLSRAERTRLAAMACLILAVNAAGWAVYILEVMPQHFVYRGLAGSRGLGVGLGVAATAWFLGLRHAFDADHISAIDNTTRKLMAEGSRPLGTGFFFALGHSSVIVAVGVAMTVAARAVFGAVVDPKSAFESTGGTIGTLLAASFLYLIGALNLVVLAGIVRLFRGMQTGAYGEDELEALLQSRGFMNRFLGRLTRSVDRTWKLFFVGMVFGIGFDTATEVVLLSATAYAAIQGLPYYAVLALPALFSGGMMLLDTVDGVFMNLAYGWAFAHPARKLYYNIVVTGLSVGAAFIIGTIEVLGVLASEAHLRGWFWEAMAEFNINLAGFAIAALFVVVWTLAIGYWKLGGLEARWATVPASPSQAASESAFQQGFKHKNAIR